MCWGDTSRHHLLQATHTASDDDDVGGFRSSKHTHTHHLHADGGELDVCPLLLLVPHCTHTLSIHCWLHPSDGMIHTPLLCCLLPLLSACLLLSAPSHSAPYPAPYQGVPLWQRCASAATSSGRSLSFTSATCLWVSGVRERYGRGMTGLLQGGSRVALSPVCCTTS